ncbi:natriuretic peptides A [Discoglossus pictus]
MSQDCGYQHKQGVNQGSIEYGTNSGSKTENLEVMGTSLLGYITFIILFLAVTKAKGSPIYGSNLSSDLTDLKSLLERLEDRLPAEEPPVPPQDVFAQNYDTADISNPGSSWTGDSSRSQTDMVYNRGSWGLPEKLSPLKSKLQELLNVPRSMRMSTRCFGGRIDTIGSKSGMGCNSHRQFPEEGRTDDRQ